MLKYLFLVLMFFKLHSMQNSCPIVNSSLLKTALELLKKNDIKNVNMAVKYLKIVANQSYDIYSKIIAFNHLEKAEIKLKEIKVKSEINLLYKFAKKSYQKKNYKEALSIFYQLSRQSINEYIKSASYRYMGNIYIQLKNYELATECFNLYFPEITRDFD
jgi:tetratricopeptide (TPR) repeat protein